MIHTITLVFGIIAVLLGGLWLLQGQGIVHLRPNLCFADCVPLQGPSGTWAVIGAVTMAVGGYGVFWSHKHVST
jgi:hypothetical protein